MREEILVVALLGLLLLLTLLLSHIVCDNENRRGRRDVSLRMYVRDMCVRIKSRTRRYI